jgi:hypothetical protein
MTATSDAIHRKWGYPGGVTSAAPEVLLVYRDQFGIQHQMCVPEGHPILSMPGAAEAEASGRESLMADL